MGEVPKLTPEISARIIGLVRGGVFLSQAAEASGVHRLTALEWMRRGEDRDARPNAPIYRAFADGVRAAKAEAAALAMVDVKRATPYRWLAAYDPETWSEQGHIQVHHSGEVSVLHSVDWVSLRTSLLTTLRQFPDALAALRVVLARHAERAAQAAIARQNGHRDQ
jgi:hypothetical protein